MYDIEVYDIGAGKRLRIIQDEYPESPRDWDNTGSMVCFHRQYRLGDEQTKYREQDYDSWAEVAAAIRADGGTNLHALYLYDHGGISMTMEANEFDGTTRGSWDSGVVGLIYYDPSSPVNKGGELDSQRIDSILASEVKTYDKYLRGEVCAYRVEQDTTCSCCGNTTTEVVDSCYGFYSVAEAIEASGMEVSNA